MSRTASEARRLHAVAWMECRVCRAGMGWPGPGSGKGRPGEQQAEARTSVLSQVPQLHATRVGSHGIYQGTHCSMLRQNGIDDKVEGFGSLLLEH